MTQVLPKLARRSRFLLDWNAAYCLERPEQALDAITGQVATFSRTSTKTAADANGILRTVPYGLPAMHWAKDPVSGLMVPGVLLEGTAQNLIVQPGDITAANGWTIGALTATPGVHTSGILSFTRLTDTTAADAYRTVTFATDGKKACTWHLRFDGSIGNTTHMVYDATAAAFRAQAVVTWAADGTATIASVAYGTLLSFTAFGDGVYRLVLQSTTITAANTNHFRPVTSSGTTAHSIQVTGVMAVDGPVPSSYIPQTTTPTTRAADAFTIAFNAYCQAITVLVRGIDQGTQLAMAGTFEVGQFGTNPSLLSYRPSATQASVSWHNGAAQVGSNPITSGINIGDTLEERVTLSGLGVAQYAQSINGGVENLAGLSGAAAAIPANTPFGLLVVRLGSYTGVTPGGFLLQQFRVAAGGRTLAQMRAA